MSGMAHLMENAVYTFRNYYFYILLTFDNKQQCCNIFIKTNVSTCSKVDKRKPITFRVMRKYFYTSTMRTQIHCLHNSAEPSSSFYLPEGRRTFLGA